MTRICFVFFFTEFDDIAVRLSELEVKGQNLKVGPSSGISYFIYYSLNWVGCVGQVLENLVGSFRFYEWGKWIDKLSLCTLRGARRISADESTTKNSTGFFSILQTSFFLFIFNKLLFQKYKLQIF
jgi:hypothetical protein